MSTPTLSYIKTGGGREKNFDKNWGSGKDSLGLNLAYVEFRDTGV